MASVRFNLNTPKAKKSLVVMVFHFRYIELDDKGNKIYKTFKYSNVLNINPKFWDFTTQRAKHTTAFPEYSEFNLYLDKLESTVKNIYFRICNEGLKPTPETIRTEMNKIYHPKPEPVKLSFFDYIRNFIRKTHRMHNTVKHYKQTCRILKEFDDKLTFESINMAFYNKFIGYLERRNFAVNTIGGHVKNLKVFMNYAVDIGLTKNKEHLNRRFVIPDEKTDHIYLTDVELQKIYNLDLTNDKRLEKVRDLFIVSCYSGGLHYSDLVNIIPENIIKDGNQMKIKTKKTGETVIIPEHWSVKNILQKYNYALPQAISNHKMNEYIKEIGKLANICEAVITNITKGGIRCSETHLKYQLITVHTARRSFATNAFLAGIPTISIMVRSMQMTFLGKILSPICKSINFLFQVAEITIIGDISPAKSLIQVKWTK